MAKIDVIMPQMGESIAEGTLSKWLKKVGDAVKRDEPIDLGTGGAEIPAPMPACWPRPGSGQTVAIQTVA
jgi:2-oxoglutarate dehydrogenase E2 component (dihydrolipoamide succinyltransferase)